MMASAVAGWTQGLDAASGAAVAAMAAKAGP
jgi:hypothetical protein